MNIYLIRHSKAEPASPNKKDYKRELTQAGLELINNAANQWRSKINNFDYLFTSPFIRAVQTTDAIKNVITVANEIVVDDLLKPGCKAESILQIADSLEADDIAFVGHQPDMSFIASKLISSYEVNLKFSPAAIAKISFKENPKFSKGVLEFLLPA